MVTPTVDYLNVLSRRKDLILGAVLLGAVLGGLSTFYIQKRYKVSVSVAMQSQYFQIPLLAGFAPEVYDAQELRSQRETLIHRALSHKFLSDINARYGLLGPADAKRSESYDLDLLGKQFEIIPSGSSGYVINYFGPHAEQSYQIVQDFIAHLRDLMAEERHATLLNLHDAIEEQLEKIAFGKQSEVSSVFLDQPTLIQHRIDKLRDEISSLKKRYNDNHPRITELKREVDAFSRLLTHGDGGSPEGTTFDEGHDDVFAGTKVNGGSTALFDDLLKKYRYLEVVIHLDQQSQHQYLSLLSEPYVPPEPVWPRLPILLTWGIAGGFFFGSALVLLLELKRGKAAKAPHELDAPGSPPPFERALAYMRIE